MAAGHRSTDPEVKLRSAVLGLAEAAKELIDHPEMLQREESAPAPELRRIVESIHEMPNKAKELILGDRVDRMIALAGNAEQLASGVSRLLCDMEDHSTPPGAKIGSGDPVISRLDRAIARGDQAVWRDGQGEGGVA